MTANPLTIAADQTMSEAHNLLYERRVRHLPVLRGAKLVGMLYERDFVIASLGGVDLGRIKVEEAMSVAIYRVSPETPLERVAHEMAAKRLDAVVVVSDGAVAGILTTVDVCAALSESLKLRPSSDELTSFES